MSAKSAAELESVPDLTELEREYRGRTPQSARAHERAAEVLPGGETRAVNHYSPHPVAIADGAGSRLFDVDSHEYIDLVNNYTSLVHGNAYAPAREAVAAFLGRGTAFASVHSRQVDLAELLVARLPSVEMVRFTNSGSEAGVLASRLAQHVTGRRRMLLFDGGYHGSAQAITPGDQDTVVVPYGDLEAVDRALTGEVAAVFAEPFLGAGGVIPAEPGFLTALQGLARERGALFVLDEVQSARTHVSGVQGELGLQPDLTQLGKIIGGGMPIGALGGRADLLRHTASRLPGQLSHSGTFNGHLAAAAAGVVTLRDLDQPAIGRLNDAAAHLATAIESAGATAGFPVTVTRAGSILNVHFTATRPTTAADVRAANVPWQQALHLALLTLGVYTAPRGMLNLSTAITEDDLRTVQLSYTQAFARLARCRTEVRGNGAGSASPRGGAGESGNRVA